jgi:hypothetical protein
MEAVASFAYSDSPGAGSAARLANAGGSNGKSSCPGATSSRYGRGAASAAGAASTEEVRRSRTNAADEVILEKCIVKSELSSRDCLCVNVCCALEACSEKSEAVCGFLVDKQEK